MQALIQSFVILFSHIHLILLDLLSSLYKYIIFLLNCCFCLLAGPPALESEDGTEETGDVNQNTEGEVKQEPKEENETVSQGEF